MRVPPRGALLRAPWTVLALLGLSLLTAATTTAQGRRQAPLVLKVGTVHPVSGPAIENGVIVMRGPRIVAVGSADSVEIPSRAKVLEYPDGHAYPGLIDPLSTAFAPASLVNDRSVNAGTTIETGLDPFEERSQDLVRQGITTAYVANRSSATWRGQGLVIRPGTNGFREFAEVPMPGVHYRISTGNQHPLQRAGTLANFGKEFESIEAYEKSFEEYEEKKKEYDEAFEKYLDYHRKKNGIEKPKPEGDGEKKEGDKPETGGDKTGGEQSGPAAGGRRRGAGRGRRGGRPGGRPSSGGERPAESKPAAESGAKGGDEKKSSGKDDGKAPKRPKAPKEPKKDDAKEAYKMLRDGEARLIVDARHPDEIRRAAEIARENELVDVVLEGATGLTVCADEVAPFFRGVFLTDATPQRASTQLPEDAAGESLPVVLERAGMPVAFGSGSLPRAMHLPTIAAEAVGYGMTPEGALRALTLTPAKLLGIDERVGSLEKGKLADVVVFSGPLFSSQSRIVHVLSAGRTVSLED